MNPRPSRANWTGMFKWGLVTVPIKLYTLVSDARSPLNLVLPKDGNVVEKCRQVYVDGGGKIHEQAELIHAFPVGDGFIPITDEDLEACRVEAERAAGIDPRTIETIGWVKLGEIPPTYYAKPQMMLPDDRSEEAYQVLVSVMKATKLVPITQYIDRTKHHLAVIYPDHNNVLICHKLVRAERIADTSPWGIGLADVKKTRGMVGMARQMLANWRVPFDITPYPNVEVQTLQAIIEAKANKEGIVVGHHPEGVGTPAQPNIIDALTEMLATGRGANQERGETA